MSQQNPDPDREEPEVRRKDDGLQDFLDRIGNSSESLREKDVVISANELSRKSKIALYSMGGLAIGSLIFGAFITVNTTSTPGSTNPSTPGAAASLASQGSNSSLTQLPGPACTESGRVNSIPYSAGGSLPVSVDKKFLNASSIRSASMIYTAARRAQVNDTTFLAAITYWSINGDPISDEQAASRIIELVKPHVGTVPFTEAARIAANSPFASQYSEWTVPAYMLAYSVNPEQAPLDISFPKCIDLPASIDNPESPYQWAKRWLGTQYRESGGNGYGPTFSASGSQGFGNDQLVGYALSAASSGSLAYSHDSESLLQKVEKTDSPTEGDVVFVLSDSDKVDQVGILGPEGTVILSSSRDGSVIEVSRDNVSKLGDKVVYGRLNV